MHAISAFMQGHAGSVRIHRIDGIYEEERTYPRNVDLRQSPG